MAAVVVKFERWIKDGVLVVRVLKRKGERLKEEERKCYG